MTNLVFLEAATQSEGAAEIIESNEALINFATAEVDSLVEEQALHTAWYVGSFVEESFDTTYENMTDPISDIVIEATSIFADVIASDDLSDAEKKELIEGYAHIIAMGDLDSWEEASFAGAKESIKNAGSYVAGKGKAAGSYVAGKGKAAGSYVADKATATRGSVDNKLGTMSKLKAGAAGTAAGAAAGAGAGAAIGASIGAFSKIFSKERKAWKSLVKQEKEARKKGADASTLSKIHKAKLKAHESYVSMRNSAAKKGAKIGGAAGAIGGGVAGGMYGKSKGMAAA